MKGRIHIVSISDTHGRLNNTYIPPCDVVTISGDFSALRIDRSILYNGELCDWITDKFLPWLVSLPCKRVIFIPGNHDFITAQPWFEQWFYDELHALDNYYAGSGEGVKPSEKIVYLCYQQYTFMNYTFYGCPTSDIHGWAWSANGDYTKYKVSAGIDVMLVHQAPDWMGLGTSHFPDGTTRNFGSNLLMNALQEHPENLPKLLLCGHIHTGNHLPIIYEAGGKACMMVNVSTIDEDYKEYFYARNFILDDEGMEDKCICVGTWVSPSKKDNWIGFNKKENFVLPY